MRAASRHVRTLPIAVVMLVMLGGALFAWVGGYLPIVEPVIAISVLVFGILAASAALVHLLR